MDVFDLLAKISLDTSEYDNALDEASGKTSSFASKLGSGLKTAAKVGAAAVGVATTAATAFAKGAVDVGAQFDASMSQVAATMGTTVDEIGELRNFAQEMGASTAFSATEAADALNYMALAGYTADESMQALPNVLNLAAAGGIDLARASDMVTDAQSALGLSMEESAELVDKMAKASSKSNTSVAQLGDAILTIGGTAKNLAGGTTELSTALGILADNGIKGAEGGTALRNIILSLSAPTNTAAAAMESLGLDVYDAAGNMRPLNDVFGDLDATLSTMTQGEQTEVLNTIFNKVDLKSVNALLANTGERFDELSGYIDNATGAAQAMAETQLDNLAGDVTMFQSAMEGAKIIISDQLTPTLREFVQFGTESVSTLSTAFKEGGLSGAMEALGTILSDGLSMVINKLPEIVDAGMQLLGALGQGLLDNLPIIVDAAVEIILMLTEGLISALPEIVRAAIEIIARLADGISEALPELIPSIVEVILEIVDILTDPENLSVLFDAAVQIIAAIAQGLVEALPELLAKAPEILLNLGQALISAIPELIEAVGEIGVAIVEGIWNGIKSSADSFISNVKDFFSSIVDGVKDLLGIHSPSRVFASIGENMALGLGNGWDDEFSAVRKDIESGMNFGTATMDLETSGLGQTGRTIAGGIIAASSSSFNENSGRSNPIDVTLTLDGAVLARKLFDYSRNEGVIRGSRLVFAEG